MGLMHPDDTFYESLQEDDAYFECLGDRVWIMDNHRWAYWVWEMHRAQHGARGRYDLLHFDFHWDAGNDFHDSPEMTAALQSADLEKVLEWVSDSDDGYIRFDSFIAPAIIRGLLSIRIQLRPPFRVQSRPLWCKGFGLIHVVHRRDPRAGAARPAALAGDGPWEVPVRPRG
jgi:hypothetical protein